MSHRTCTGISPRRPGKLISELAGPWTAQQESRLREPRGGRDRLRAEGAGPNRELPFADRVIATLVILRFQLPHAAVALFYEVDRSTITRAVHEVRPLLAARGLPHAWHASIGGRDRLAWTAVYQRCPETGSERDRALRSVHDSFEQAFRGFDRDRYPVWRDWLAGAAAHPRRAG